MTPLPADTTLTEKSSARGLRRRCFPEWLKRPLAYRGRYRSVTSSIEASGIHTVCIEARCPNRAECFSAGTATFLILGTACTRTCAFCGVNHDRPHELDGEEPARIASAASLLNLRHIVITSVTRDDLPDGGAAHFAETVRQCRKLLPHASIEILIPDFGGSGDALDTVIAARPDICGHNLETVPRLYRRIRPQADFERSIGLLAYAGKKSILTKSGIMVGLGETEEEVLDVLRLLRGAGCRIVTIGQYLQPSETQVRVVSYEPPAQFDRYRRLGYDLGFDYVAAGPFMRSSYRAAEAYHSGGDRHSCAKK